MEVPLKIEWSKNISEVIFCIKFHWNYFNKGTQNFWLHTLMYLFRSDFFRVIIQKFYGLFESFKFKFFNANSLKYRCDPFFFFILFSRSEPHPIRLFVESVPIKNSFWKTLDTIDMDMKRILRECAKADDVGHTVCNFHSCL